MVLRVWIGIALLITIIMLVKWFISMPKILFLKKKEKEAKDENINI
jgi:hypothetical protein